MNDDMQTTDRCPIHGSFVFETDGRRHCNFSGCDWTAYNARQTTPCDPISWKTHQDPAFNNPEVILDRSGFEIWLAIPGDPKRRVYLAGKSPAYANGDLVTSCIDWAQPREEEVGGILVNYNVRTDDVGLIHVELVLHPTTSVKPEWLLADEAAASRRDEDGA